MKRNWNYLPLFKSTVELMRELRDEDFGKVVRAALSDLPDGTRPEGFSDMLYMLYKYLLLDARKVYERREAKIEAREKRKSERQSTKAVKDHYQSDDIDPEEALRLALIRSFGEES